MHGLACRNIMGLPTLRLPLCRRDALAILQMVERTSADSKLTRVEAVPNPEQVSAEDFSVDGAWPFKTGAQDILLIASAFVADGFDVRSVVLVDRLFRVADETEYADVEQAVLHHIASGNDRAALRACREVDLFAEQVRLFERKSAASVDVRQNGVIIAGNIEIDRIGDILSRAFDVR
ncbi:hypothetical protein [Rhodococcoides fascians]|uniref:hypothetical protein n=1 Tax=Rhodococcoides fascians TaxID=1828 RepID=UPI00366EDF76